MKFTIDESMSVLQVGTGLAAVAKVSWLAVLIIMILLCAVIEAIMPGALTLPAGRDHAGR